MSSPEHRAPSLAVRLGAVAVAALVAIPIVYLTIRANEGRGELFTAQLGWLVARSVGLALVVGVVSTLLALALAVLIEAVDLPLRRIASIAVVAPLAIPSYVAATAYVGGVSPTGPFAGVMSALGFGRVFPEGFAWAAFVLVTSTVPLAFLPLRAALAHANGELYDAARTLGCSHTRALAVAVRPVIRGAVRAGFVVVVLYTLAELGTVALLRYDALPRVIYSQFLSAFDRAAAARTALVLVALVVATVVIAGGTSGAVRGQDRPRPLRYRLGRGRFLALAPITLYALLAAVVPIVSLATWLVRTPAAIDALPRALIGSLQAALIVAVPCTAAAIIVAVVAERGGRTGRVLARFVDVGFALPGLVVALGLAVAALRVTPSLYQGWVPYIVAMMILFVPLGVAAIRGSLAGIPPSLEDAARTLGATRRQAFWRVTMPLVRPGVLAALALVVISTAKELGATLLILPTGKTTLAVQLWDSIEEARYGLAAAPALVLIAFAALAAFAVERKASST